MTRKLGVLGVLVLTAAAAVHAQQKSGPAPAPAPPPAPKMTPEGKKFVDGWLGTWTSTDTTYTMGGQKMQGTLKMTCEGVSSGWGALCKAVMSGPGMPPSESTFLMGWDVATGQAHMFEIADTAEVHDHSGKWINDKSVSLVRQGRSLDGKMEKDACTATWVSARELKFDCTGSQAGATVWTFTSTCKK
jgi:hypothetical protein